MNKAIKKIYKYAFISKDFLCIIPFGSRVYGVTTEQSDYDYYILTDKIPIMHWGQAETYSDGRLDIHLYGPRTFEYLVGQQNIGALECLWLGTNNNFLVELRNTYTVNYSLLRNEISHKASNSWVKAKKKLEVAKEYRIGKKSLWHSLRILMFGIQIAKYGRIINYQEANYLYDQIVNSPIDNWEYFNGTYKKLYNSLSTDFRKVAPK